MTEHRNPKYADLTYQRTRANFSAVCNLCGMGRVRVHIDVGNPQSESYWRAAMCPTCDQFPPPPPLRDPRDGC